MLRSVPTEYRRALSLCFQVSAIALVSLQPDLAAAEEGEGQARAPASIELVYTADVWMLAAGDGESEARYLDNFDFILNADLEKILGTNHTTVSLYGLYNNGTPFSEDIIGDAMVVSNIEAPVEAVRLYEAWVEHRFGGGPLSARFGLYDLNSEFDALEASSFFIGSAHGIGADISQSGEAGPSIFPITSLALRLEYQFNDRLTFKTAVLDGVPGDPDKPVKTTVKLSGGDGALIIGEADYRNGPLRMIGGYWRYTSSFDRHDNAGEADSFGAYIRGESILFERENKPGAMRAFFRAGWASGEVNQFSEFYSAGVVYDGVLHPIGKDQFGIAVAYAGASDAFRITHPGLAEHEAVIEASYRAPLTSWFAVQPNLQYIINPGLDPIKSDAIAAGVRFEIGWSGAL